MEGTKWTGRKKDRCETIGSGGEYTYNTTTALPFLWEGLWIMTKSAQEEKSKSSSESLL